MKVIKHGKSVIIDDKYSNRIYLMKLFGADLAEVVGLVQELAKKNNYSKIFGKVSSEFSDIFQMSGYSIEAEIPNFYDDYSALFVAKYFSDDREKLSDDVRSEIRNNIDIAIKKSKNNLDAEPKIDGKFYFRRLSIDDTTKLAKLYKTVFPSYPFPIDEPEYLKKAMNDDIDFYGIFDGDNLVAASSSEKDADSLSSEMTDFATLPDYGGNNFSNFLLWQMESDLRESNYRTVFTIARSHSTAMNITFARNYYNFCGTLKNNTNIFGRIESMNVWAKSLR
jgi:beta-lysine N6-acetyltransferase